MVLATKEAKGKGVYPQGSLGNLPHVIPAKAGIQAVFEAVSGSPQAFAGGDEIKIWVKLQIVGARHAVPLLKANKPTPSEWIREKEYESVPKGEISKDCTIMYGKSAGSCIITRGQNLVREIRESLGIKERTFSAYSKRRWDGEHRE